MFVWSISFEGNSMYSDEELEEFLERNNIKRGDLVKGVDVENIEFLMRENYNKITWVSARVEGTRIIVNMKENKDLYIDDGEKSPCNIVSDVDGVIESIITRTGKPMVKKGMEVKKGDIIVSGFIDRKSVV